MTNDDFSSIELLSDEIRDLVGDYIKELKEFYNIYDWLILKDFNDLEYQPTTIPDFQLFIASISIFLFKIFVAVFIFMFIFFNIDFLIIFCFFTVILTILLASLLSYNKTRREIKKISSMIKNNIKDINNLIKEDRINIASKMVVNYIKTKQGIYDIENLRDSGFLFLSKEELEIILEKQVAIDYLQKIKTKYITLYKLKTPSRNTTTHLQID